MVLFSNCWNTDVVDCNCFGKIFSYHLSYLFIYKKKYKFIIINESNSNQYNMNVSQRAERHSFLNDLDFGLMTQMSINWIILLLIYDR